MHEQIWQGNTWGGTRGALHLHNNASRGLSATAEFLVIHRVRQTRCIRTTGGKCGPFSAGREVVRPLRLPGYWHDGRFCRLTAPKVRSPELLLDESAAYPVCTKSLSTCSAHRRLSSNALLTVEACMSINRYYDFVVAISCGPIRQTRTGGVLGAVPSAAV